MGEDRKDATHDPPSHTEKAEKDPIFLSLRSLLPPQSPNLSLSLLF